MIKALFIAAALLASAAVSSAEVLYTRNTAPESWTLGAPAPATAKVTFNLALRQRNLDILDKWFTEVSNPLHHNYQQYKTIDEIRDLVSPPAHELERVWSWLHKAGIHHYHAKDNGDSLEITTSVGKASQLFATRFHTFKHADTGAQVIRTFGDYSVPDDVSELVDMVTGLSSFPVPHLQVMRPSAANDYGVVPQTIDNQYQISKEARQLLGAAGTTSQGVIEFQGQSFSPSNLATFASGVSEKLQVVSANHTVGPNDPNNAETEAELDIQMVAAVNLKAENWFWLEQGNGWLYEFTSHFFATQDVPQVNSISYGWWEADQCTIAGDSCSTLGVDSVGYSTRVNTEFAKIGARGITLFAASGDSGANGRTDPDCSAQRLRPSFPGSSPYITAVGATELTATSKLANSPPICQQAGLDCVSGGTEQAVSYAISGFASGGGFSDIFPQPSWQADAVKAYITGGVKLPPSSYFNKTGRGFPDVGALGHNLIIYTQGQAQPVGGTSASSPIFASVLALLNEVSLAKTGKLIGFANPLLYKMHADCADCFHDVIVGDNKCTEQGCGASCQGYECAKGWDPVTGLGTPNFAKMAEYIKNGNHMKVLPTLY